MLVSVDIALNTTGVAVFSDEGELVSSSLVKVTASWDYYKKISYLYQAYTDIFDKLLTDEVEKVTLILEGRLKAGWRASALASIEGARVTCYLAYHHVCAARGKKTELFVYDPNEVKHSIAGKRNADKAEMRQKSVSSYSWLSQLDYQEDIFDAVYLALHHMKGKHEHSRRGKKKP